jgi:hypothetical protein
LYGFASLYASHYPDGNILCGHEIAPNAIYVHSGIPQPEKNSRMTQTNTEIAVSARFFSSLLGIKVFFSLFSDWMFPSNQRTPLKSYDEIARYEFL